MMSTVGLALLNIARRKLDKEAFRREYSDQLLEGLLSNEFVDFRARDRLVLTDKGKRRLEPEM